MKHRSEAQELAFIGMAKRGAQRTSGVIPAEELIAEAIRRHGDKLVVSWSGGRCSTVVLFMALKIDPNIKAFFNDMGGAEMPETIRFVRETAPKYHINLTIVTPEQTIWEVFRKYGYPKPRRVADPARGIKAERTPKCCDLIKEKPLIKAKREAGIEAELTGLRASEAHVRMMSAAQKGMFYFHKKHRVWRYNPIIFWTTRETVDFIKNNDIPDNPAYLKYDLDRTGCWPCTAYRGWQENMARINPKFYTYLTKQLGPQRILEHFYQTRVAPCSERG